MVSNEAEFSKKILTSSDNRNGCRAFFIALHFSIDSYYWIKRAFLLQEALFLLFQINKRKQLVRF